MRIIAFIEKHNQFDVIERILKHYPALQSSRFARVGNLWRTPVSRAPPKFTLEPEYFPWTSFSLITPKVYAPMACGQVSDLILQVGGRSALRNSQDFSLFSPPAYCFSGPSTVFTDKEPILSADDQRSDSTFCEILSK